MEEEKRMAGDYEIIQSFHIGDREIVIGENPNAAPDERFMCAFCVKNEIAVLHSEVMVSDDYTEIVQLFAERIAEQAKKTRESLLSQLPPGADLAIYTAANCRVISHDDNLNKKVVVIKPEVLRREYQMGPCQLKLCTGGFGASPHSRGSACFCIDLRNGSSSRFERMDVLGTIDRHDLPRWAKDQLAFIEQLRRQEKRREER